MRINGLLFDNIFNIIQNGKLVRKMGVYLNPGNENFKQAINSKIYIDKTGLIAYTNEVINTLQKFVCVSRPRRFGKSMAANMLAAYYGRECDSQNLFARYKIAEEKSFQQHLNQYNVIFLNVQNALSRVENVEQLIAYVQNEILIEIKEHYLNLIPETEKFLSAALEKLYSKSNEQFIFIVDEWDCIFRSKNFGEDAQTAYLDFLRDLLKDKAYVALAYMTGILPIKKYGNHSALNMFDEFSMTDPGEYAQYIGFTENEVKKLCEQYNVDFTKTKEWYDGYVFHKSLHIYNPKSVVDSIRRNRFANYWTQTETYEALRVYIDMNFDGLKDAVIQMLAGERINVNTRTFQNDMSTFESKDDVLTLLIHLGYLVYNMDTQELSIPNEELQEEFRNAVERCNWKEVVASIEKSEKLLEATWSMEEEKVAHYINQVHCENIPILKYNDENSLRCVIALAYYNAINEYTRIQELPAGKGFADVVYIPRKHSNKPALVIELKYDKSAEGAIAQIKKRNYVDALKEYQGNVLLVGINYDRDTKVHQCMIEKYEKAYD